MGRSPTFDAIAWINDRTTSINQWVALLLPRRKSRLVDYQHVVKEATRPHPNPNDLQLYLRTLSDGWSILFWACALVAVGLAFVGDQIAGGGGSTIGLAIGAFPAITCLAGEFDAAWRWRFAKRARQPGLASHERDRLVGIAQMPVAGIALHLAAGLTATIVLLVAL